jgi:diadenylate cyclase
LPDLLDYLLGPDTTLVDVLLALLDVAVVAYLVYRVLRIIRGTRAVAILLGLFLVGLAYLGAQAAGLETLSWVLGHFLSYSFIFGVIVLFQADIRRGLAELGRSSRLLAVLARDDRAAQVGAVDAVVKGAVELARRGHGALIVLERSADLGDVVGSGLRLDAALTPELLISVFLPQGPIHDGAAVIQGARLAAAGCLLPLSSADAPAELGTRHRAALGLADEVDAAVVVVSEERGEISVALEGALHRGLDEKRLRALLHSLFVAHGRPGPGGLSGRTARPVPTPPPGRAEGSHATL